VTAREEKRLMEYHKKLERDRELRNEDPPKSGTLDIPDTQPDPTKVSLIAALFTTSPPPKRDNKARL